MITIGPKKANKQLFIAETDQSEFCNKYNFASSTKLIHTTLYYIIPCTLNLECVHMSV